MDEFRAPKRSGGRRNRLASFRGACDEEIALYGRLVGGRIRSQLQYPKGFALDVAGTLLVSVLDLLVVLVLFSNVRALGGWTAAQVCLLYGVAQTAFAIADAIFGHLDQLPASIRSGDFDSVLLKPRSSLLLSIAADFSLRRVGQLLQAVGALTVAWIVADVPLTPASVGIVAVTVVTGVGIFGAIWVLGAATTFWTIDTMEITNSFTYGGRQATSYPMTVYGAWLRRFITFAVPLACIAYFPVRHLVGLEPPGTNPLVRFVGIPAGIGLGLVAGLVWQRAVRSYRGTGS